MNFSIENGVYGKKIICHGGWSEAFIDTMHKKKITEIELNSSKGWFGENLNFLNALADILIAVTIIDLKIKDVSAINSLRKLRYLNIQTYCNTEIKFNNFIFLEECVLNWRAKANSISEAKNLKDLYLYNFKEKDLSVLSGLKNLEKLRIKGGVCETIQGIAFLKKLKNISLINLTKLKNLDEIEMLQKVEVLVIDTCKKIDSVDVLGSLKKLKILHINNCGNIESLAIVKKLNSLEELFFWESTNIQDGQLNFIKEMELKNVRFQNRRHYSLKREDI